MAVMRIAINVVIFALFFLTELKNLSWTTWSLVFITSELLDTASTFASVRRDNWDWRKEQNLRIQSMGRKMGFVRATWVHTLLVILIILYTTLLISFVSHLLATLILVWLSAVKIDVSIHNFSYAFTGKFIPCLVVK